MAMNIGYLELRYSDTGGPGEASSRDSIGGPMSATVVNSQATAGVAPLAGATVKFASGHSTTTGGNLVLRFDQVANTLAVGRAATGTFGVSVAVEAGTNLYRLVTPQGGAVHVSVDSANLPGVTTDGTYAISNVMNGMFDNITKDESYNGMADYRCFYLTNTHPTDSFYGVKVYVSALPTGGDTVAVGVGSGVGDGVSTGVPAILADENTPPGGVVFFNALTANTAILVAGTLAPGQCASFWAKRSIPAETVVGSVDDVFAFTVIAGI